MADPIPTSATQPSLVEKLATIAGVVEMYVPVAGQYVRIANVAIHALADFLQKQGQDKEALAALHAEYQRRIAIAEDPNS